jgi:hypothetical protein
MLGIPLGLPRTPSSRTGISQDHDVRDGDSVRPTELGGDHRRVGEGEQAGGAGELVLRTTARAGYESSRAHNRWDGW